jgi:hypothetical protein
MSFPTPKQIDAIPAVSAAQLLKLVDLTIAKIMLHGQAISGDGRELTRADLNALRQTRADLAQQVADETPIDSSGAIVGVLVPRYPDDA